MNKTKIIKKENEGICKTANGITLIALIVTIIVLIILAGITINLLMSDNGILTRAKGAKEEFNKSKMLEDTTLILMDYSAERELTGITLEEYLTKNNISYEKDGTNIKFVEEGYELTVNPITLEIDGPVKANKAAQISLNSNLVNPGETLTVILTFGEDIDVANCKYKFEKSDIAVEKGNVTTQVPSTTINITTPSEKGEYYFYLLVAYKDTEDTELKKVKVTVDVPVTGVTFNQTSLNMFVGESINNPLTATVEPASANQVITWSTSNSSIATVDQTGKVTAVGGGTAQIIATSNEDTSKTATCNVTVKRAVTLNSNGGTFADTSTGNKKVEIVDGKITLPTITKANATFRGWYTSNSNTATKVGDAGDEYVTNDEIQLYAWWYASYVPTSNDDEHVIYQDCFVRENNSTIHAFDNNFETYACSVNVGSSAEGSWIGWDFESPVYVTSVSGKIRMKKYKIEYADSLDGQWTSVAESTSACSGAGDNFSNTLQDYQTIGAHRYCRIYVAGNNTSDSRWSAIVYELQFTTLH